ncbi:hypothetical protein [Coxiella-like endosymbiont of Rhipicephalus sanguineus]|nr:hypothetical protein [Coxiella-like endosymbiont of Rhipicephalus sanguineus]
MQNIFESHSCFRSGEYKGSLGSPSGSAVHHVRYYLLSVVSS